MRNSCTKYLFAMGLLLTAATGASASVLGLDVTSDTQTFVPGVFTNIGWQFSVSSPVIVDGLGIFDVDPAGLAERHQVGLWDNSGTLLAQTTVSSASTLIASVSNAGDWLFGDVAPTLLLPGTYVTGGFFASSADDVFANATISLAPQISFLASRASSEVTFAEPGVYGLVEPGVFAADIRLQTVTTDVPEPTSLLLFGAGLAGLAGSYRRRKQA